MLTPGARPAIHRAMSGQTGRASTHRAGIGGPRAVSRRPGPRWLTGVVALASAVVLPLVAAGPASADQARQRQQWVLSALNVPEAWQVTQGKGVTVAVIDSGVDPSVSDLTGSVRPGPDYSGVHTSPKNRAGGARLDGVPDRRSRAWPRQQDGILGVAPSPGCCPSGLLPTQPIPITTPTLLSRPRAVSENWPSRSVTRSGTVLVSSACRLAMAGQAGLSGPPCRER